MIGILAEKPSAARNFAAALGGMTGTYDGEHYTIVASHGHLYGLDDEPSHQVPPDKKEKYADWSITNLPWDEKDFRWKYKAKDTKDDTPSRIASTLAACDEICIATDNDPTGEGELLAWEILWQKKVRSKKYSRMYFEDESPASVQKAFRERKTLGSDLECMFDDPDYKQALFRTKWDYLSMQWSRVATKINNVYGQVLRNGRLKSAMIVIVGDQLKAVNEYVKKPFFQNRFKDENGIVYTSKEEPMYDKKEDVPSSYNDSTVVLDSKTMKCTAPPKFLDLSTLSAVLAGKGIDAKTVLATYQAMYTDGIVSYPRTEDHYITEAQFEQLLPLIDQIADVIGADKKALTHREPRKTHIRSSMAHGANRPGLTVPKSLESLDAKYGRGAKEIYVLLARNYLATICEDYEYEQQKGHVKDYPKFIGTANVPKSLGWKSIYDSDDKDDDENLKGLGKKASPFIYEGANQKPTAPTMKWLMKQLEKRNVGTGATRTSTYADVTNSKTKYPLLVEKRGKLSFAPCGESNYRLLNGTHIGDLTVTEHVMSEMKDVAAGKVSDEECLHEIQQMIIEDIAKMQENHKKAAPVGKSQEGSRFPQKEKAEGVWTLTGKHVSFSRTWGGHTFTDQEVTDLLAGKAISFTEKGKYGDRTVSGKLDNCTYNGHSYIGFAMDRPSSSSSRKKLSVPDSWCGHRFSTSEKKKLEEGNMVKCVGCTSKKGSQFDAKVKWKKVGGAWKIVPEWDTAYKK